MADESIRYHLLNPDEFYTTASTLNSGTVMCCSFAKKPLPLAAWS